jgi:hypothetical protein
MGLFGSNKREDIIKKVEGFLISGETILAIHTKTDLNLVFITNKRVIIHDTNTLKISFLSIPYSKICSVFIEQDVTLAINVNSKEYKFIISTNCIEAYNMILNHIL